MTTDDDERKATRSDEALRDALAETHNERAELLEALENERPWLVAMTKHGEDRIWRGATRVLHILDAALEPPGAE